MNRRHFFATVAAAVASTALPQPKPRRDTITVRWGTWSRPRGDGYFGGERFVVIPEGTYSSRDLEKLIREQGYIMGEPVRIVGSGVDKTAVRATSPLSCAPCTRS